LKRLFATQVANCCEFGFHNGFAGQFPGAHDNVLVVVVVVVGTCDVLVVAIEVVEIDVVEKVDARVVEVVVEVHRTDVHVI
jgi:hypothetical protein